MFEYIKELFTKPEYKFSLIDTIFLFIVIIALFGIVYLFYIIVDYIKNKKRGKKDE